jgi:mRNA interferase MazF
MPSFYPWNYLTLERLPRRCVVNCDHLQTVSKDKIGALIATLSLSRMTEVAEAISFALALTE